MFNQLVVPTWVTSPCYWARRTVTVWRTYINNTILSQETDVGRNRSLEMFHTKCIFTSLYMFLHQNNSFSLFVWFLMVLVYVLVGAFLSFHVYPNLFSAFSVNLRISSSPSPVADLWQTNWNVSENSIDWGNPSTDGAYGDSSHISDKERDDMKGARNLVRKAL